MPHPNFTLIRQTEISNLNIKLEEYRHNITQAQHLHLSSDDDNNVFLVAFLTVPQDSTGVAHILEHTTLCGSRRYPVRDPFFMMIRRSLNTFMNAFTSNDWTAYPFASKNVKDFNNLMQVYLDAVFFPNLDELDFAQEGCRVEFEKADDPTTALVYKGVVFNEMKGSLSSPLQRLRKTLHHHLFPTTTYHYNSGGDPEDIPNLTHNQLKEFHADHYHPSNAIFMTYGNRPAEEHQQLFQQYALQHFQKKACQHLQITDEQRYTEVKQIVHHYPIESKQETKNKTHIILSWLLNKSTDIREVIEGNLLSGVLLDNSSSPLRHALETTSLGTSPSCLSGFDESTKESSFTCGLEGSNPEQADEVEALIFKVLNQVAEEGVPIEVVESVLHQIELYQREITGGSFPYGLRLVVNILTPIIHGGDPVDFLDLDLILATLRKDIQNPKFIPNLTRKLLLNNQHQVRVIMAPDTKLAAEETALETTKLANLKAKITSVEQAKIIEQATALTLRQQQPDDPELLPKVGLEDIPKEIKIPKSTQQAIQNLPATWFACGTNGIVYQKLIIDLPLLEPDLMDILPLFCNCMTEVGRADKDYQAVAAEESAVTGGIYAHISLRGSIDDRQIAKGFFALSGKSLVRNQKILAKILQETLEKVRFDELTRLRELISEICTGIDSNIASRGQQFAMNACNSGLNQVGYLQYRWSGLMGVKLLKSLDDSLQDATVLKEFAKKLERIRDLLLQAPRQLLVISEEQQQESIRNTFTKLNWQYPFNQENITLFKANTVNNQVKQAWRIHTQINFCAKAYPTVPINHPDSAALRILGTFLQNGYLHGAIREKGGAYGGGASYNSDTTAFSFYSHRDPRLLETLADFEQVLTWLQETKHEPRALEEAILTIMSRIDRPGSPAGEAVGSFFSNLHGRTPEKRSAFRQQILQVTIGDLQRVATTYLQEKYANIVVLSNAETLTALQDKLDLEPKEV